MQTEVRGDPRLEARDAARVRPAQAEVELREREVPEEILAHERREEEEPHGVGQTSPRVTIGVSFRSQVEAPIAMSGGGDLRLLKLVHGVGCVVQRALPRG